MGERNTEQVSESIDMVSSPPHYRSHPSGIECIEITELLPGNLAAAFKYVWRAGLKWDDKEDLNKSIWYLDRTWKQLADNEFVVNSLYTASPTIEAVLRRDLNRVLEHTADSVYERNKGMALSYIIAVYTSHGNKSGYLEHAKEHIKELINGLGSNIKSAEAKASKQQDFTFELSEDDPFPHPETY